MKKRDLKKLALLGITSGIVLSSQAILKADQGNSETNILSGLIAESCGKRGCNHFSEIPTRYISDLEDNIKYDNFAQLLTENQLLSQLNELSKQMYKNMTPEGKTLALKLASRSCQGNNECKGQNACMSEKNACYGRSSCKGTSKCTFKDKNLAIKVAAQQQAEKRAKTNSGS